MSPRSDEVRVLLERFCAEAPGAARSVVRETARNVVEGLGGEGALGEWLQSRGGRVAIAGGMGLFAMGFLLGRTLRADRRALLRTGVAAGAGLAAGWIVASQTGRRPG
ncbi:MAG: hypothetical protein FJX74_00915 [Armatimonadetes bacterium]|nr:hypothetical protein [Armatimonadota bacterium]